jgi:hypothetical protein
VRILAAIQGIPTLGQAGLLLLVLAAAGLGTAGLGTAALRRR